MYYNVTFSSVRAIIFAEGKGNVLHNLYVSFIPMYTSWHVCVCAIQSFVACPDLLYFSPLSHKRQKF